MTHADNHGDTTEQTEKLYYYHADHLQSAQFITDANGEKYEHIEYTPYGELWIEETAPGVDKLPFRFTGKELDTETVLYYYGARYLDPKYSRWLSGEPALGEYIPKVPIDAEAKKHNENLPGMGGVYNTVNLHVYHYAGNNPVKYTDPDGRIINLSSNGTAGNGLKQSQTDASIVKRTAGLFLIGLGLLLDYGSPLITGFIIYSSGGTAVAAAPAINAGSKALGKTLELAGAALYLGSTFDDRQ